MANGQDRGRPGQYQQGSGQQYPQQGSPWPPQPYHPDPHRQRFQGPPPGYGQVQPYAPPPPPYQGYPPYARPQCAAPQYAPPVAPKSTGTGLVLGLLLPGVGCMYAGRPGMGTAIMVTWLISIPLVFVFGIGFLTGLATWIASATLGYTMTRQWNAAHGIVSLSAGQSLLLGTLRNATATTRHRHSYEAHHLVLRGVHYGGGKTQSAPSGRLRRGRPNDDVQRGFRAAGSARAVAAAVPAASAMGARAARRPVASAGVRPGRSPAPHRRPAARAPGPAATAAALPAAGPAVATAGIPALAGTSGVAAARVRTAAARPSAARAEAEALARPAQDALRTYRRRRDRYHRRRRVRLEQSGDAGRGQHRRGDQPCIPGRGTLISRGSTVIRGGGTVIRRGQLGSEHARCSR